MPQIVDILFDTNWPGGNAGSGSTPTNDYNVYGPYQFPGNPNNLSKQGYTLLGWSTDQWATTPLFTLNQSISNAQDFESIYGIQDFTVYLFAVWQADHSTYSVTYNGNGATGGQAPTDNNAYQNGSIVTVLGKNTLTKTNHIFLGWSTDSTAKYVKYTQNSTFTLFGNRLLA